MLRPARATATPSLPAPSIAANRLNCDAAPDPNNPRDVHNGTEETTGPEPLPVAGSGPRGVADNATLAPDTDTGNDHAAGDDTEAKAVAAGATGLAAAATHSPPPPGETTPPTNAPTTGASGALTGANT
jgi:hypothetical protein